MNKNEKEISMFGKMKEFIKSHKKGVILCAVTGVTGLITVGLYGKNQKLKGENSNLKDMLSGAHKTIEKQAYIIGKQNQKLYGRE